MGIETALFGALPALAGVGGAAAGAGSGLLSSLLPASISSTLPFIGQAASPLAGLFPSNLLPLASSTVPQAAGAASNFAALPGASTAFNLGSGAGGVLGDIGSQFLRGEALQGLDRLVNPQQPQFLPPPQVPLQGPPGVAQFDFSELGFGGTPQRRRR